MGVYLYKGVNILAWSLKFNSELKIIELIYSGLVSPSELNDAFVAASSLLKKEQTSLALADCSKMVGGHSITDLYFLIILYESNDLRGMKEAIILPSLKATIEEVKFYEMACLNMGYTVKIFSNVEDATTWLIE